MPLVAHTDLPSFDALRSDGHEVLTVDRAEHQDIRALHIGVLNMMPDAALVATEQQYLRLIAGSNQIVQVYAHIFTVDGIERGEQAAAHIDRHYAGVDRLREDGLDGLVITGANVAEPRIEMEPFWDPLRDVVEWARESVTSVLCSCLASHALFKMLYGIDRTPMPAKRWGVYPHYVVDRTHPLMRDINTRFDVPHSRWNDVSRDDVEAAGLHTLAESKVAGLHMAVSPDRFRFAFFQGHPEYDRVSLLKEYKREVTRFLDGELDEPPPHPEHYLDAEAQARADAYLREAAEAEATGRPRPDFPEAEIEPGLDNTWGDTARGIFHNWLGLIYRYTNLDRGLPFMPDVDPDDPLGLGDQP